MGDKNAVFLNKVAILLINHKIFLKQSYLYTTNKNYDLKRWVMSLLTINKFTDYIKIV